jgi:hypothetical protein
MADHRDHRMLEAGVADSGQREQELAGEPGGVRVHRAIMPEADRAVQSRDATGAYPPGTAIQIVCVG